MSFSVYGCERSCRAWARWATRALVGVVLACTCAVACEPKVVVGKWNCDEPADAAGGEYGGPSIVAPIDTDWTTGFEDGICGYRRVSGFCYSDAHSSYSIVSSPVHSGKSAAAFTIDAGNGQTQVRCVRQGALPKTAYYGAWYFISTAATSIDNWNLFHFQGGAVGAAHGLWDVSLTSQADETLRLNLFSFLDNTRHSSMNVPSVPIGSWFRIQVYIRRANDATGEIAVYQDGQRAIHVTDVVTDDTSWGQWYVGNLAVSLDPAVSTVYVDDVSISDTL